MPGLRRGPGPRAPLLRLRRLPRAHQASAAPEAVESPSPESVAPKGKAALALSSLDDGADYYSPEQIRARAAAKLGEAL